LPDGVHSRRRQIIGFDIAGTASTADKAFEAGGNWEGKDLPRKAT
jgi:hypothetical protein